MGDFRIVIEATGGHGCDRNAKEGSEIRGCGQETCPDCMMARFVSEMQRATMRPYVAEFHHWPSEMAVHYFPPGKDKCSRCNQTQAAIDALPGDQDAKVCRGYSADREVVDDYTERDVKYPTGAFRRATGIRIKGSF